jgi:branched-chain amino acid transport system permease protein
VIASDFHDKQPAVVAQFDATLANRLRARISDALVNEHRDNVAGPHSDALARLLNFLRRAPAANKCVILMVKPFAEYRLAILSGKASVPPRLVEGEVYATADEAQHAVFLRRLHDLVRV